MTGSTRAANAAARPVSEEDVRALEDAYWDVPADVEATARQWLASSAAMTDSVRHRLIVLVAKFTSRRGDNEAAVAALRSTLKWALEYNDMIVLARCERVFATIFDEIGDGALALEHAAAANAAIRNDDSPVIRAAVRLCLADALGTGGSQHEARAHYDRADQLAQLAGAGRLRALILNNRAYSEHLTGNAELAQLAAEQLTSELASTGVAPAAYVRDTLAVIWLHAGRLDEAESILSIYLDSDAVPDLDVTSAASGLLVLSAISRGRGDLDRAACCLDRAEQICVRLGSAGISADAERERAELLAARGDHRAAFEMFKSFHDHVEKLRALEREARGRVLHVLFEADEARRDREVYRHLSERDPLTGLYNRRHVDQCLPGLLAAAAVPGGSLTLAFVDLDHFKTINDTLTHQVGDEVLRRIACILDSCSESVGGLAARMGGEEFLIAAPDLAVGSATAWLEDVRQRVQGYDWREVSGSLPVTASIGAVLAPHEGDDRAALLRLADERLYAAKLDGRNRVVFAERTARPEPVPDDHAEVWAVGNIPA